MQHNERLVVNMPLTELWDECGPVNGHRGRSLNASEIKTLLREGAVRFVIADCGSPLRWVPHEDRFDTWKIELQPCLIDPRQWDSGGVSLGDLPRDHGYHAVEWEETQQAPVVLFELHH